MAISAIVAAVSTATAVVTGGALILGSVVGHFLVTTAMGAALNALTPKPNIGAAGSVSRGYSIQGESGAALDHQIIYGRARVGGVRVFDGSSGAENAFLHRVIAFAGHEIESYDEIYLNDQIVTLDGSGNVISPSLYSGFVRIQRYFGTTTQTAASIPVPGWDSNCRLQGIAYLYVRFEFNADVFPNGVPSVSATIKGKKVFDPRTATTAWSDNPALCLRDYLTSDYGMNQPADRIDDSLVATAATVCDQFVDAEKRYTCNGSFVTGFPPSQIISDLITSMGGLFWYSQGKWRMKAARYTAPTVSFDENDLRSGISLSTRHSRRTNFNTVKGTFRGPETDWQTTDYPAVSDPAFVSADNGIINTLDYPLPYTITAKTAQRLANIALRRNREQLTFSASFGLRAFQVQVGDFVSVTNTRFGWTNKVFEVVSWTFGLTNELDLQVQMTLREISAAVFNTSAAAELEQNNTELPSPFSGLDITGLTASDGGRLSGDGTFIPGVILQWNPAASSFVRHYEVEWRPVADSVYSSTTTVDTSIELSPVIDGINYVYRVRAITQTNNGGPRTSIEFTTGGDTTPPALPTSITATGEFRYIVLDWTPPNDADFNYVEIYENTVDDVLTATLIGRSSGDNYVRGNLGVGESRFYYFKSVDFSGNKSAFSSPYFATTVFLDDADFADGVVNLFLDQGLGPVPYGNTFPTIANDGDLFFYTIDGQLYVYNGVDMRWELRVEPGSIVASDKIVANTITGGLLATSGIITNSAQIGDALITNAKIGDLAVDRIKIATGSVTDYFSFSQAVSTTVGVYGTFVSAGASYTYDIPSNLADVPRVLIFRAGVSTNFSTSFVIAEPTQIQSALMRVVIFNNTLGTTIVTSNQRTINSFSARGGIIPETVAPVSGGGFIITDFYTTNFLTSSFSAFPEEQLTFSLPANPTIFRPGDSLTITVQIAKTRNFSDISSVLTASTVNYAVEVYYR